MMDPADFDWGVTADQFILAIDRIELIDTEIIDGSDLPRVNQPPDCDVWYESP